MAKSFILTIILSFLISIPFSCAQITLSDPNSAYNLGDELKIKVGAVESSGIDGIMSVELKCDSYDLPFFVTSVKLSPDEIENFNIEPLKLSEPGVCMIQAELKKSTNVVDSAVSNSFLISDRINISYQINRKYFLPGERIEIIGTAEKANGMPSTGTATVSFDNQYSTLNVKGRFAYENELSDKVRSGKHLIIINLSDSYGNKGTIEEEIIIKSVPTSLEVNLNQESFLPEDTLNASITLYDQAFDSVDESIAVTLYNPWGMDIKTEALTNGTFDYTFSHDAVPGNWWIYAFGGGIKERKFFYVGENEKIDFEMVNNTLKIKNLGNVDYQKLIQIIFSSENTEDIQAVETDISVNKEQNFVLSAPDGDYNITVKGEGLEKSFSTTLTGKAIGIKSDGIDEEIKYALVIFFIAAIIALSVLARYKMRSRGIKVRLNRY